MAPKKEKRPHGQLRQSQVVMNFGPGSLVDLPTKSIIIGGLDDWSGMGDPIPEPRLIEKIQRNLELSKLELRSPPGDAETSSGNGIRAWQFPEWFVTPLIDREGHPRSRMLVHRKRLSRGIYIDLDKKKHSVVPVRFIRACRRGHIGEINWFAFVHEERTECRKQLWMQETGSSGDISEITISCECGRRRSMAQAALTRVLGLCDGCRPWLGAFSAENCDQPNRLLVRHASNAYFPHLMSVISLPDRNEALAEAISDVWDFLELVESEEDLKKELRRSKVKDRLSGFGTDELLAGILARKSFPTESEPPTVKQAEFDVLSRVTGETGTDSADSNFYALPLPESEWNEPPLPGIERIILVKRIREVTVQIGFTRFESISTSIEGELEIGAESAALARETTWLPAIENRGEGIFLLLDKTAVEKWYSQSAVQDRERLLRAGYGAWKAEHPNSRREFPNAKYFMVHSLSHMLLTAISLNCGYPASSLRERVYSLESGYGILLFTASPDSEGTLGGLVEAGSRIREHLKSALEISELCSNDPVCSQHKPTDSHESRHLHGAACHGCLLVSETSCEQQNDFLDRALVIRTLELETAAFFPDGIP